jgi:phytoene dehydrogenase-like protein
MADKSVIIIGAGVAGLTAGCYGQMNGYSTQIFEMDSKPGGLCTAWERKGYTIDGCLHWLVGSSPDSGFYRLWQEVGALHGKQVINHDQFFRVESTDDKVLTLYTDVDRLEQHLKEIAPEDSAFIEELTKAIRHFTKLNLPVDKAPELYSPVDKLKIMFGMSSFIGDMRKWSKMTIKDVAMRFQNPFLREAFQMIMMPDFSSFFLLITMAWLAQKNAGYVIGGSMGISRSMEQRYLGLGGQVNYARKVERILVEDNRAVGVRLEDGSVHKADYVVSAADGHSTIFDLLEGKYVDETIRGYYEHMPIFQPIVFVALGVNRSFKDVPKLVTALVFPLEKPIDAGGKEHKHLAVHIYNFDSTFAPPGKTVVTVMLESNFAYWDALRKDMVRYNAEKAIIASDVISALDKRFPGLARQVEMIDVATPYTFYRYTGNWQGSYEGWLPEDLMLQMKKTLPGLDNFYMIGQWVNPGGGLPSGLMTGRHVIQMLCKRDKKKFTTTTP